MNINEFNDDCLNELLNKLFKENKNMFLLGDFNINQLNFDTIVPTNEFLDSLSSHYFLPHILQPTRMNSNSKTLIDNVFSNMAVSNTVFINLTASIPDHLLQALVSTSIFFNSSYLKSNKYLKDWLRFDQLNFALDYFPVDWDKALIASNMIIDVLCKTFLETFESLLKTLFTCCSILVVKSLVVRCKICSLLVAEVARCKKSLVTRCEIPLLIVVKNNLLLVAKNHSSLVKTITSQ